METIFGASLRGGERSLVTHQSVGECSEIQITRATVNLDSMSFSPGVKNVTFTDCTIAGLKTLLLDTSRQNISDLSLIRCKFEDIIDFDHVVTPHITHLTVSNVQFSNLSSPTTLHGNSTLMCLRMKSDRFDPPKSFDFLRSNKSIRKLILRYPHHNLEESLDSLRDTNITHLTLSFKKIQSLECLRYTTLLSLNLSGSSLPSLDPLEGNETLTTLDISVTKGVVRLPTLHRIEKVTSSFSDLRDLRSLYGNTHLLMFRQQVGVGDSVSQRQVDAIQLQTQFNRLNSHLRISLRKLCRLHLSLPDSRDTFFACYPSTMINFSTANNKK